MQENPFNCSGSESKPFVLLAVGSVFGDRTPAFIFTDVFGPTFGNGKLSGANAGRFSVNSGGVDGCWLVCVTLQLSLSLPLVVELSTVVDSE